MRGGPISGPTVGRREAITSRAATREPSRSASRPPRTSGPPAWNGAQVFLVLGPELPTERGFLVPVHKRPDGCAEHDRVGRQEPTTEHRCLSEDHGGDGEGTSGFERSGRARRRQASPSAQPVPACRRLRRRSVRTPREGPRLRQPVRPNRRPVATSVSRPSATPSGAGARARRPRPAPARNSTLPAAARTRLTRAFCGVSGATPRLVTALGASPPHETARHASVGSCRSLAEVRHGYVVSRIRSQSSPTFRFHPWLYFPRTGGRYVSGDTGSKNAYA
jgi:hypothetical protein